MCVCRCGAPVVKEMGPVFARDGDSLVIKTSLVSGAAPFSVSWRRDGRPVAWSSRVTPYHKPGSVGLSIARAGPGDEAIYSCTIANAEGEATFTATLVVDCE